MQENLHQKLASLKQVNDKIIEMVVYIPGCVFQVHVLCSMVSVFQGVCSRYMSVFQGVLILATLGT